MFTWASLIYKVLNSRHLKYPHIQYIGIELYPIYVITSIAKLYAMCVVIYNYDHLITTFSYFGVKLMI